MILVVGGAGYIGSHLLLRLRQMGTPHLAFDNFERGHKGAVQSSSFFRGDLRSPNDLAEVFRAHPEIDLVMHFAAYAYVGESVTEPGMYYTNNVTGVINLLDAMKTAGVNKLIFSSTCATFGEPEYLPLDEKHPQHPINPYGETKLVVEHLVDSCDKAYGLKTVCFRYFNAAGADPDGTIGEDHRPEAHLIPNAIFAAMGTGPSLKLFGTDYPTPDGTNIRDYIHVLDLADAHLLGADHLRKDGDSRKYNLANGDGFSNRQVLDVVSQVVGTPVPYEETPRRPGDPARLVGTSEAVRKAWGWQPKYPDLETIVKHAYSWHKSHPRGYEI